MHSTTEKRHGRLETRTLHATTRLAGYLKDWHGAAQVCRVERSVERGGHTTRETVCLITSLSRNRASAERLLAINRGHWGIENRLHWVLDAVLGEDRNRGRTGGVPLALRLIRGAVLTLLRVAGHDSVTDARLRFCTRPLEALALVKRRLGRAQTRSTEGTPRHQAEDALVSCAARASALRASPARSLTSR